MRAALMNAARELFLKFGFERVTARQIAAAAGTTPAMIHYYFENKIGLFRAMLQQAIEPFAQMLRGISASPATPTPLDIAALAGTHIRVAAANTWIAPLIINEVLAEGGKFRAAFVRDIAGRFLPMLVELLERERRAGKLRADLDPQLAALSLLSLNVFPILSHPITGPLLGIKLEGPDLERLITHTTRLLLEGIGAHP